MKRLGRSEGEDKDIPGLGHVLYSYLHVRNLKHVPNRGAWLLHNPSLVREIKCLVVVVLQSSIRRPAGYWQSRFGSAATSEKDDLLAGSQTPR